MLHSVVSTLGTHHLPHVTHPDVDVPRHEVRRSNNTLHSVGTQRHTCTPHAFVLCRNSISAHMRSVAKRSRAEHSMLSRVLNIQHDKDSWVVVSPSFTCVERCDGSWWWCGRQTTCVRVCVAELKYVRAINLYAPCTQLFACYTRQAELHEDVQTVCVCILRGDSFAYRWFCCCRRWLSGSVCLSRFGSYSYTRFAS